MSALATLGQGHPGGQARPEASLEPQKLNTSHAKYKVPLICEFYSVFLRVGVTKYCKLQGKKLTSNATGSSYLSTALHQHRENPKCKHCLGKKVAKISSYLA